MEAVTGGGIRYSDAGVDIEVGDQFTGSLEALARRTHRPEVIGGLGGFAGLFAPNLAGMEEPVLVSGTDGVGTKLLVAQRAGRHDTVGIDLVAMCVNDVLTVGAEPLFFLDYYATGRLAPDVGRQVVAGIAEGCRQARCALLGGETAEMPGMYKAEEYDLAGFCVGVVDRPKLLDGRDVRPGDVVLACASSGLHSNGYSLVRHVLFEREGLSLDATPAPLDASVGDVLLRPTRIYVQSVMAARAAGEIHAMAHITGGGIAGNLVRVLPEGVRAVLDRARWDEPPIFTLLRRLGVPDEEMDKTFNLGLGYLLVVQPDSEDAVRGALEAAGERCLAVGHIEAGERAVTFVGEPLR